VLTEYLPIVAMAVLAVAFGVASLVVSRMFRPHRPNPVKLSPYECGNDPVRLPRGERFSVKFYVVAMLFIIFDIEIIFLFPWAVRFRQLGLFGLVEMAFFIGLVFVAYIYVWRAGGLDWATSVEAPADADLASDSSRDPMAAADEELAAAMHDAEVAGAR